MTKPSGSLQLQSPHRLCGILNHLGVKHGAACCPLEGNTVRRIFRFSHVASTPFTHLKELVRGTQHRKGQARPVGGSDIPGKNSVKSSRKYFKLNHSRDKIENPKS